MAEPQHSPPPSRAGPRLRTSGPQHGFARAWDLSGLLFGSGASFPLTPALSLGERVSSRPSRETPKRFELSQHGGWFSLSFGERIPLKKVSRFEPLNLVELLWSAAGCSVAALPFGASWFAGLPAGEIGSSCRHAFCLVTPLARCSRWGGLSFHGRLGTGGLASSVKYQCCLL